MKQTQQSTGANGPREQEAVRTTIVGGRPPGSGKKLGAVPRGVEVLIKKAAVDPQFMALLVQRRAEAAETIDLMLKPFEAAMLNAVSDEHLMATIAKTEVPREHRRAFLGTAATAMLAALVGGQEISGAQANIGGFGGFAAGSGTPSANQWQGRVIVFISKELGLAEGVVTPQSGIRDLAADDAERKALRKALEDRFDVTLPAKEFDELDTIEALNDHITDSLKVKQVVLQVIAKRTGVPTAKLKHNTLLTDDLEINRSQLANSRRDLGRQLRVFVDWEIFKQFKTVGEVVNYAGSLVARRKQAQAEKAMSIQVSRGVRPDIPPPVARGIRPDKPE